MRIARLPIHAILLATALPVVAGPGPSPLAAQVPVPDRVPTPPVVDTIIVTRRNVFSEREAANSGLFRTMNRIHVVTKESLIRKYLQFEAGAPYDSAQVAESERQLRLKKIFRELSVDSVRVEDERLAVRVQARDGWSLKPKFGFSIASTGDWTGTFGLNELNLLGTGNQVYAAYVKELDRDGLNAAVDFDRMLGTEIDVAANYAGLSDGKNGNWIVGLPFRNTESAASYEWDALWADQNVNQYRAMTIGDRLALDTLVYRRDVFVSDFKAAFATRAQTGSTLRLGATVGIRKEQYAVDPAAGAAVDDSVYGTVGLWGEISQVRFRQYQRFNGFGVEDIDLSPTVRLTATLAPAGLGWVKTGFGGGLSASGGRTDVVAGHGWVWASVDASYLWNAAVRDSGRVVANIAAGFKPHERHSTAVQIQAGRLWNPAPGNEFDLGFDHAPRGWEAHSFVGTRSWWAQLEHRYYAVDRFLGVFAIGFGAFLDYGGAWYEDQASRSGGSVGAGLRLGSALATVATTGRIDVAYKIGAEAGGNRWVIALGSGFTFPRRTIPTINYRAQPPP